MSMICAYCYCWDRRAIPIRSKGMCDNPVSEKFGHTTFMTDSCEALSEPPARKVKDMTLAELSHICAEKSMTVSGNDDVCEGCWAEWYCKHVEDIGPELRPDEMEQLI